MGTIVYWVKVGLLDINQYHMAAGFSAVHRTHSEFARKA